MQLGKLPIIGDSIFVFQWLSDNMYQARNAVLHRFQRQAAVMQRGFNLIIKSFPARMHPTGEEPPSMVVFQSVITMP